MSQTEELPLTEPTRTQEKVPAKARPIVIVVQVIRQCIFAFGVGLFVYSLMLLIQLMNGRYSYGDLVAAMAGGAGLVSLVLPLPRRWVW